MPVTEGLFDLSKSILTVSSSVRGGSREKIKIHITNRKTSREDKNRSRENKIKIYPQKVEKGEINNI